MEEYIVFDLLNFFNYNTFMCLYACILEPMYLHAKNIQKTKNHPINVFGSECLNNCFYLKIHEGHEAPRKQERRVKYFSNYFALSASSVVMYLGEFPRTKTSILVRV